MATFPNRISSQRLVRDSQMAMPEQAFQVKRIADYLYAIGVHMGAIEEKPVEPDAPVEPAPEPEVPKRTPPGDD